MLYKNNTKLNPEVAFSNDQLFSLIKPYRLQTREGKINNSPTECSMYSFNTLLIFFLYVSEAFVAAWSGSNASSLGLFSASITLLDCRFLMQGYNSTMSSHIP